MPKKQKLGDWPIEVDVYTDEEADHFTYDVPTLQGEEDKKLWKEQVAEERRNPHPASLREDD